MKEWKNQRKEELKGTTLEFMGARGSSHAAWQHKKTILKQKHNINWLSPVDLNKDIVFD